MSSVAVVILNFNGRKFLEKFLPSFIEHSGSAEIIIADNASADDSLDFLKTEFPSIRTIVLEENFGFAGGYNEALEQVESDYFAIVNSDIEVTINWLDPLVDFLEANEDYVSVQPKIKMFDNKELFEHAGAAGGFIDNLGYPYCRGRLFDTLEKDEGQYQEPIDVDWTSGACMVIRAEAYKKAGGFDASFFAHMEEIDLCWRLRSTGWKMKCLPESTVFHVGGGTLNKTSPRKTYLNFRNGLSLLVKNLPAGQLIWKLPARLIIDGFGAVKMAMSQSSAHFLAVIKAHFHFYARFRSNWKSRTATSGTRSFSAIWYHFVKGRKEFTGKS